MTTTSLVPVTNRVPLTPLDNNIVSRVTQATSRAKSISFRTHFARWLKSSATTRKRCKYLGEKKTLWSTLSLSRLKRCARHWPMRTSKSRRKWRDTKPIRKQRTLVFSSKLQLWGARKLHWICNWSSWRDAWPRSSAMWVVFDIYNGIEY